ncbi:MAG: hypothetical protein ACREOZ_05215 [Gloeomargaritales cyanobacterium]
MARKFDEKDGCTVMVAMEMKTGELLQPFIIFTGKFGKTLMEYYKPYKKSKIITTENHWMTEHAMRIWLDSIRQMFPGRRIGITYDRAPAHTEHLETWVEQENNKDINETFIIVDYIDKYLTAIYQPCDVVINHTLKSEIRQGYSKHISSLKTKPGDKLKVRREQLIKIIENAFNKINESQKTKPTITPAFELCGLNPFAHNTDKFDAHIQNLTELRVYETLLSSNNTVCVQTSDEIV